MFTLHSEGSRVVTGTIFNIQRYAIHDGPGIRVTVFLKGCPLRCWWCHNPESQCKHIESVQHTTVLDDNSRIVEEGNIGNVMTVTDVMREIEKDRIFFDESGGGVTFSGGEPLMQPEFLKVLLKQCKEEELHTVLDTTGYASPEIFDAIFDDVDLFLYDLKLIDDALHRQYTGVSNVLILENLQQLSQQGKPLWIRFPVIPGITDTQKNILDILDCITNIQSIEQMHLLPYHRIGEGKYQRFRLENKMAGVVPPSKEQMQALKEQFEHHGLTVKIGG